MPRGYMLRTTGEWKDGKWQETPRLEGPVNEDPQYLVGTLNGKIPVQLWYQQQGAVLIGEVRYTKSGSGKPIKLVGEQGEYDGKAFDYLFEYTDDGHQTGIWRITQETVEPYRYSGSWVAAGKGNTPAACTLCGHGVGGLTRSGSGAMAAVCAGYADSAGFQRAVCSGTAADHDF